MSKLCHLALMPAAATLLLAAAVPASGKLVSESGEDLLGID